MSRHDDVAAWRDDKPTSGSWRGSEPPHLGSQSAASTEREQTLRDVVGVLRVIRSNATHLAKRSTGEGYTYEQGRIAAVDEIMEALNVR